MTTDRAESIINYSEKFAETIPNGSVNAITGFKNPDKVLKLDKGLRFNDGKIRYDLIEPSAIKELAKVFTKGAEKYAPRNWEKGMEWSKVLASLKRHTAAFEQGEDYDNESGLYHMAHAAWNALALVSYYKLYPQGDDRPHHYLNVPKIGLDIDEIICNWVGTWCEKYGHCIPKVWNFSYETGKRFLSLSTEEMNEFYLNIPPKISPDDIPFEPHCYITSRSVPVEITKAWIEKNNFPTVPVYSVGFGKSKVDAARESGVEIFLDDRYENFVELNKAGICTFLLDAPHNERYDVGYKRVKSIKELFERFK